MRIFFPAGIAVLLSGLAFGAQASSDDAWAEFYQRVTRSCVEASGIRRPLPSVITGFDDRVGTVAMLVMDRARGSNRAKLCLYDKRRQIAYIDDAEGWSAPPGRRGQRP